VTRVEKRRPPTVKRVLAAIRRLRSTERDSSCTSQVASSIQGGPAALSIRRSRAVTRSFRPSSAISGRTPTTKCEQPPRSWNTCTASGRGELPRQSRIGR
jgi:hypothetical protein